MLAAHLSGEHYPMRPPSPEIRFAPRDRLLVFAPHPDDETLACGELIQSALAAGAAVRVVFATDGDNNPWPQRWLEKRWRIGAAERRRWGERRRAEAARALAVLGDGAIQSRFLGCPDQGLTDALMRDDALVATLREDIAAFAPSHVALPSLGDRHPDHSALHVAIELALLRARLACVRLAYVIHGADEAEAVQEQRPSFQQRKCGAMACYASQLALSRRRLLKIAQRAERFAIAAGTPAENPRSESRASSIAIGGRTPSRAAHDLLVVVATRERTWRARLSPREVSAAHGGSVLQLRADGNALDVMLPPAAGPVLAAWTKWHRAGPRIVVFDRCRWHALGEPARASLVAPLRMADQTR